MVLTKEILDELFKLYEELDKYRELHSEQLKTVQDQFKDRKVSLERDGKTIEVTEKTLWDEIRFLGIESQAGQALKERYPDVFASFERFQKLAKEAEIFVLKYMGFDYTQMTLSNYVKLTLALIEYARTNPASAADIAGIAAGTEAREEGGNG